MLKTALAAGLAVVAFVVAPNAAASPQTYLYEVDSRHVQYPSASAVLDSGLKACEVIRNGGNVGLLAANAVGTIGDWLHGVDAGSVVIAAVLHLCPDQRSAVIDWMHTNGYPDFTL